MSASMTVQERAQELFNSAWLDEGLTQAEIDQSREIARRFNELLQQGYRSDELNAAWAKLTPEQILEYCDAALRR